MCRGESRRREWVHYGWPGLEPSLRRGEVPVRRFDAPFPLRFQIRFAQHPSAPSLPTHRAAFAPIRIAPANWDTRPLARLPWCPLARSGENARVIAVDSYTRNPEEVNHESTKDRKHERGQLEEI